MSKSKQKGTSFERLIADYFATFYPGADRRPLMGAADKGDLLIPHEDRYIAELKNVARLSLGQWLREAEREAENAGVPFGVVIHKRHGNGKAEDQWCSMTLKTFLNLVDPPRS